MKIPKWEYLVVSHEGEPRSSRQMRLNELGDQGWELVAVDGIYSYFKRLKSVTTVADKK
jgi:hypothetical protein